MRMRFAVAVLLLGASMGFAQSSSAVGMPLDHSAGEPVRVSSGTMAGQLLKRPSPQLTSWERELMYATHGSSSVVVRAIISETGHVEELQLVKGSPGYADAAMRAFQDWVYRPYLLNGKPVRVDTTLSMSSQFGGYGGPTSMSDAIGIYTPPIRWPDPFCDSPWAKAGEFHKQLADGALAESVVSTVDPLRPPGESPGSVMMKVCVAADGRVEKAEALFKPGRLGKPAEDALLQWRYKPYVVDGKGVPVMGTAWVKVR